MAAAIATADPRGRHSPGRRVDDKNLVFDQMGIRDELLRGIYAFGFEKPSAIQQRAVVPIIQGRDVIAQAQSGTGKSSIIALYVVLVSATFPKEILELTNRFMADPIRVLVKRDELMLEGINQFFVAVEHDKWKFGTFT
ncbi:uncharacterized protein LOC135587833 [Musa acuminata AAA Group]|uniref:uncharacterized protein LOC135587833 n=1 Tax=Musa acuminata AAA Group TaxID=214697 RepID=UPI0031E0E8CE